MGGAKKIFKSISKVFGGGGNIKTPAAPNYEEERKKAETEALRKRVQMADKGMSGAILGGSYGDDANVKKKKLLGE
ncbi:hypothetical protein LJC09_04230 [Desulfovibrio sp. OttesenSCG-928-F20]|nr:hypothetical protein [Desulfovibrio sp. OttesenSCG-928-F20]